MKKISLLSMISLSLAIVGLGLSSCNQAEENVSTGDLITLVSVGEDGETILDGENLATVYELKGGDLSDEIGEWLMFMREEEKLAQDLYLAFEEEYNYRIFKNIARAESNHMDVILSYLNQYELDDPASEEHGVFVNGDLQNLYNELLEKGMESADEALKVGALVEEVDIADLAEVYDWEPEEDIIALTEALMLGSRNHLRAFTRILALRDITYVSLVLSVEDYEEIVNSPWERGTGLCWRISTRAGSELSTSSVNIYN